jgi:hypothetical protein
MDPPARRSGVRVGPHRIEIAGQAYLLRITGSVPAREARLERQLNRARFRTPVASRPPVRPQRRRQLCIMRLPRCGVAHRTRRRGEPIGWRDTQASPARTHWSSEASGEPLELFAIATDLDPITSPPRATRRSSTDRRARRTVQHQLAALRTQQIQNEASVVVSNPSQIGIVVVNKASHEAPPCSRTSPHGRLGSTYDRIA